ncbi:nitric oxide reductase activation protein NorD [Aureivirga sp. CE67]|uniref:nitric oxide reductase activation protein NorD n=1 Tax=Aureivirga sp. CE67 TaxID=1788983 RepID=UPI0018CA02D4|nr:VWA domain-containing protein [Aureivirga sp. CE67]
MFEPDEFIFTKIAMFFKNRKKKSIQEDLSLVKLEEVKPQLTLISRALTGDAIEIFPAENEGGYKGVNLFLPTYIALFKNAELNYSFYLFRIFYLITQRSLNLNLTTEKETELSVARQNARQSASEILKELFLQYPTLEDLYTKLNNAFPKEKIEKEEFFKETMFFGKWMQNVSEDPNAKKLENISLTTKKAIEEEIKTILKAKAVEEVKTVTIDKKSQEDFVLTHNFEKVETAESYENGARDFDGDDELESHENAVEELTMKHVVRVDDPTHSIYQTDFIENTSIAESTTISSDSNFILYDEWDYKNRKYKKDFCKVFPKNNLTRDIGFYSKTIKEHTVILNSLRKQLTSIHNKYQIQKRQTQGDDFDLDAITDVYADIHSNKTPSEQIYISKRKLEKDLSILILLDTSLSSDGYVDGLRVLDIEKQVSLLFGTLLHEFQIDFSIQSFHSKTRNHCSYQSLKGFDESWEKRRDFVSGVQAEGYTRIGTALRHSGTLINTRGSKNKWIIMLSDGKPNDYDKYEGKYGINDVKQALRELHQNNIQTYALAIESQAKYYLPQMFGSSHFEILKSPKEMVVALSTLFEKIKYRN